MTTDGVPVFTSSKVLILSLYYTINGLDYSKGVARENILLVFGSEKEPCNVDISLSNERQICL